MPATATAARRQPLVPPTPPSRRDQLLQCAAQLFWERGYSATSVHEIGRAAGVSGPAVYKHFPSKQAILDEICLAGAGELAQVAEGADTADPHASLAQLVGAFVEFAFGDRYVFRPLFEREHAHVSRSALERVDAINDAYVRSWSRVLTLASPTRSAAEVHTAIVAAHLMISSTVTRLADRSHAGIRAQLSRMALASLEA